MLPLFWSHHESYLSNRHASSDLVETQTGLPRETFSSWDVFNWLHNCCYIWFENSVMIPTCWCLQVVYIIFHVHRLLACQYMLISSKCKTQLQLIWMTLVLQVKLKVWLDDGATRQRDEMIRVIRTHSLGTISVCTTFHGQFSLEYFGPDHGTQPTDQSRV